MRRRAAVVLLVTSMATATPLALPPSACAGNAASAALVVDTGSRDLRYCVTLPRSEVTGLDVIRLAGEQHGLTYKLGYGGQAVCMLAGVGPTGDDCFEDYPDFWGYWRGDGSGGWAWSSSGAGSTRVAAGDVEGWSWGRGSDGGSHPPPPAVSYGDVCAAEPASGRERGTGGGSRAARPGPDRSDATAERGPATSAPQEQEGGAAQAAAQNDAAAAPPSTAGRRRSPRRVPDRPRGASAAPGRTTDSSASPGPDLQAAPARSEDDGSWLPAVALLGGVCVLLGWGAALARARRPD